jgi:GSH-dependent disulfide-bond oxidoreductase
MLDLQCWTTPDRRQATMFREQNLDNSPHLTRSLHKIAARPATIRAGDRATVVNTQPTVSAQAKDDPVPPDR